MHGTGQLFIREAGPHATTGKRLLMVCGLVAVDEDDSINIKGEHQYAVALTGFSGIVSLGFATATGTDISELSKGQGLGDLLTVPIWRV